MQKRRLTEMTEKPKFNEDFIEKLWQEKGLRPNKPQIEAIFYRDNKPLFITAAPGSGKTRVLLWRTLNLILVHEVRPEEIYLGTFTEKAALQLKEGIKSLLGLVSKYHDIQYDISKMAIGTIHSNCHKILSDRRFSKEKYRMRPPRVMDESEQYFYVYRKSNWDRFIKAGGFSDVDTANEQINAYLGNRESSSRHHAVTNCIAFFNRLSEEIVDPTGYKTKDPILQALLKMYSFYLNSLSEGPVKTVDLSLMQQAALQVIESNPASGNIFKHVIIDEYQDTNAVQERIFFALARTHKNICVVGDDDQALYRFRGATVENFVEFENRCIQYLKVKPEKVNLSVNYRSRKPIVDFYTKFIKQIDWSKDSGKKEFYRVIDKKLEADRKTDDPSVIVTSHAKSEEVYEELVSFIHKLKEEKKIEDYNQVAFLFPYLKNSPRLRELKDAFEKRGVRIYAPRAGRFLEVEESLAVFGLFINIFGIPDFSGDISGRDAYEFKDWLKKSRDFAEAIIKGDPLLKSFIEDKKQELARAKQDFEILSAAAQKNKLSLDNNFRIEMKRIFLNAGGISDKAKKSISNKYFDELIKKRMQEKRPYKVKHIINRATALDWTILDLFYQLNGFKYFLHMYELAEKGEDEGPICNLGLITQYLSNFMDHFGPIIAAYSLLNNGFLNNFFLSYCFSLFRLQESEFEYAEDPFPKGRISFLTIHQAKGLEFPVVVLGSIFKREYSPSTIELLARQLLKKEGEPLEKISLFDITRMFYVALSRPKNLLVLPRYKGPSSATEQFKKILEDGYPEIKDLKLNSVPNAKVEEEDLGKSYSYTADYLMYKNCPRNYMVFRKYGFVPSRTQTMFFGNLVHRTIEDLHNYLIAKRESK
jgi:DNA helicase-2/ATP-dependent DNA helicase PcrA